MQTAAFFDLDKTVIAKATLVAFSRPLRKEGYISRWLLARALWAHIVANHMGADEEKLRKYRTQALKVCTGWDQAKLTALVNETIDDVIEPLVYDEALDLIRYHQAEGHRVYLVSASPIEIVEPMARYLRVDKALATRPQIDADGKYTGEVEFYNYGENKVTAIQAEVDEHDIDLASSYAYSDSVTDLPMLEAVGHPVAVNPDKALLKAALERDWEIRVFEHPVTIGGRVPRPSKTQTMVGVGGATAAVLGAAAWAARRRS